MNSSPLYPSTESGDSEGHYLDDGEVDSMLHSAYGATLASSTIPDNEWYSRWMSITQLSGNHYFLPKGQCGRRYVNLLSAEVDFLSGGVHPSERVIVFCSVVLQQGKFVCSSRDIVCNLNRRMDLWVEGKFDLLVQEACRCDQSLRSRRRPRQQDTDHTESVHPSYVMWKGQTAMRWLTERSKGRVLFPSDSVTMSIDNSKQTMSVIDALKYKHPPSHSPYSTTLSSSSRRY